MTNRVVIAKIGCRYGQPFVTAIIVATDGHPHTAGRVLLEHYPLETDADRLLSQGDIDTFLQLSKAAADPLQATYAQPGTFQHLIESDWLGAPTPQWFYVHHQGDWWSMPVVDGTILDLLVRPLT